MMRRLVLLVAVVAVVTVALSGMAYADPPSEPPIDSGNPSCFGEFARNIPNGPGPGTTFVKPITEVAGPTNVDELAEFVGTVQQVRPCPLEPTPEA